MSRRHGASRLAWLTGVASVGIVLAGCASAGHSAAPPPPGGHIQRTVRNGR